VENPREGSTGKGRRGVSTVSAENVWVTVVEPETSGFPHLLLGFTRKVQKTS